MQNSNFIFRELNVRQIIKLLKKYQEECDYDNDYIHLDFNWQNATTEYVQMASTTKIYDWLYPINFSSVLAFTLELLQYHLYRILSNREETFKLICLNLNISQDYFYENIESIQNLLIIFNKVKICKDGKVIIMNNVEGNVAVNGKM